VVDAEVGGDGEGLGGDAPDRAGQLPERVLLLGVVERLPCHVDRPETWPGVLVPAYLSPRLTQIDPDGFTTRTISAVAAISASTNSAGVASDPIWPS
jgi:hypothetical protein